MTDQPTSGDRILQEWSTPDPEELAAIRRRRRLPQHSDARGAGPGGHQGVHRGILAGFDGIDFQVHRQLSDGDVVMNERTDVMRLKDGEPIRLPVMGVFEVATVKIAAWRDYFDMATSPAAFS